MLLQQKSCKRQSFSIESLAVSSHVVDDARDTDSPYLNYLQSTNTKSTVDYNANETHRMWSLCADVNFNNNKPEFDHQEFKASAADVPNSRRSLHPTSTPKMTSSKRRRLCSTSTPPSSSDDSNSEEQMTTEDNSVCADGYTEDEKLSPASITSTSTTSDYDIDFSCNSSGSKRKKARTAFNGEQLRELEKRYKTQKYLTASDRTYLARALKLKDQQVKTWFQNRRMKEKRQQREDEQAHGFAIPTGGVDVAQLAALGICTPPFGATLGSPMPLNYQFTNSPSPLGHSYSAHSPLPAANHSPALKQAIPASPYGLEQMCYREIGNNGEFIQNSSLSPNLPAYPRGLQAPIPLLPHRYNSSHLSSSISPASKHSLYAKH